MKSEAVRVVEGVGVAGSLGGVVCIGMTGCSLSDGLLSNDEKEPGNKSNNVTVAFEKCTHKINGSTYRFALLSKTTIIYGAQSNI